MPVNSQHKDYAKFSGKWKRCRDAAAGQDEVHAAGVTYLPMLGGQDDTEYKAYKLRALFYGATTRTIDGLSGMLFRKPPEIKLSSAIEQYKDDITRDGISLVNFAEQVAEDLLGVGRAGVLVDFPQSQAALMMADAERLRLRPYLTMYKAEQVINWRIVDGIVVMVVLEEEASESEDIYKDKDVKQWRVLALDESGNYYQQIWRKKEEGSKEEFAQHGDDILPLMNNQRMKSIPFVFAGIRDTAPCVDMPPLMALVDTNLSHYRTSADYEHGLHWCGCPQLVITGYTADDKNPISVGSGTAMILPDAQAKATLLELKADGISALAEGLEGKEQKMAALGARMLSPEKKAAEAADTAAIHRGGESSVLSSIAGSLSIALTKALNIMSMWAGGKDEASLEINRDYLPTGMSAQDIVARMNAVQSGLLSHESFYDCLVRGEVITDNAGGFEDEKEKIADNPTGLTSDGGE